MAIPCPAVDRVAGEPGARTRCVSHRNLACASGSPNTIASGNPKWLPNSTSSTVTCTSIRRIRSTGVLPESADQQGPIDRVMLRDRAAERARLAELEKLPVTLAQSRSTARIPPRCGSKRSNCRTSSINSCRAAGVSRPKGSLTARRVPSGCRCSRGSTGLTWKPRWISTASRLRCRLCWRPLRRGQKYVELGDGSRGILPEEWLKRYTSLADLGETTDGKVRFVRSQALLLDALLAEQQQSAHRSDVRRISRAAPFVLRCGRS